jgi:phosphate transport system protein
MRNLLDRELHQLNGEILRMGALVEEALEQSLLALGEMDAERAKKVIARDDQIDEMETRVEKHCLNLLALQQPLAGDLRHIGASLKLLTDLERIADHASDIAELTLRLMPTADKVKNDRRVPAGVLGMAARTGEMLRRALDAYVRLDAEAARRVCDADDEVDELFRVLILDRVEAIKRDAGEVESAVDVMFIIKYLERVGDHATNIAEWVIYDGTGMHAHLQHPEKHPGRETPPELGRGES